MRYIGRQILILDTRHGSRSHFHPIRYLSPTEQAEADRHVRGLNVLNANLFHSRIEALVACMKKIWTSDVGWGCTLQTKQSWLSTALIYT